MSKDKSQVRLICGNCARVEKFASYEQASQEGWDSPHIYGYTACSRCPGVSVYFPALALQEAKQLEMAGDYTGAAAKRAEAAAETLKWEPHSSSTAAND